MSILGNAMDFLRAYVSGTDSNRVSETNHLSAQYVWEQLAYLADFDTSAGVPYPSATGMAIAGFAHLSVLCEMTAVAGGTMSFQVQSCMNDVAPTWQNVTASGYLFSNPGGGGLVTYTTPVGGSLIVHLDFDFVNTKFVRFMVSATNDNNTVLRIFARRRAL